MCIFVQNKNLKTAEEDIICYKVLKRKNLYDSTPVSPYHSEMKWDFDKLFDAPQSTLRTRYDIYHNGWFISDGYFYSYKYYSDAYESFKKMCYMCMYMIAKCTIPKGTQYYEGIQGSPFQDHDEIMRNGEYAYASKQLIINDIIY